MREHDLNENYRMSLELLLPRFLGVFNFKNNSSPSRLTVGRSCNQDKSQEGDGDAGDGGGDDWS